MTELAAVDLTLQALKSNKIPLWQGRAAQALFYHTLHRIHPFISETIHDLHKWQPIMPKPFTMSSLIGRRFEQDLLVIKRSEQLHLRWTTLHPDLTRVALNHVVPIWQREGISIHDQRFWIRHTRIQRMHYNDLLESAGDSDCIVFEFHSPTAFKLTGGQYLAEPAPDYIFSSLFNRWNVFAADPLPADLLETIQNRLRLTHSDTQQTTLRFARGRKGIIPGFTGRVEIAFNEPDRDLRRMLNALADYALFSGVGIKTTIGMGQAAIAQP